MTVACVSCCFLWSNNYQKKEVGFLILLFGNKRNYLNVFYGWGWYSTMNATLMIPLFPIVHIKGRIFLCSSVIMILLTFIISFMLVILSLLWFMIIICGTECFARTPLPFFLQKQKLYANWWIIVMQTLYQQF